jgi:hypothetical protein
VVSFLKPLSAALRSRSSAGTAVHQAYPQHEAPVPPGGHRRPLLLRVPQAGGDAVVNRVREALRSRS